MQQIIILWFCDFWRRDLNVIFSINKAQLQYQLNQKSHRKAYTSHKMYNCSLKLGSLWLKQSSNDQFKIFIFLLVMTDILDFTYNKKCVHHKIRPSIKIIKRYNGNDPKINRVLPLPQGNHVAKFGKDPIWAVSK